MKILEPILNRRSVRRYKDTPVEDEKIMALLEAARRAPSGDNSQPWNFIIVKSEEMRRKITAACHNQKWMMQAPLHIVCVGDLESRLKDLRKKDKTLQSTAHLEVQEDCALPELKLVIRDTAIAIDHLVLQAESLGLATCWVAWFEQNGLRPVLNIPADKYVIAVICVGYAVKNLKARARKPLTTMVHYERWGRKASRS
jgi:nitroreductase